VDEEITGLRSEGTHVTERGGRVFSCNPLVISKLQSPVSRSYTGVGFLVHRKVPSEPVFY